MALVERVGDLFTTSLPVVGHGVNTHGVMGAGVAAQVRRRWPQVYAEYQRKCREGLLAPGEVHACSVGQGRWVLNLATQDRPGSHARLGWVDSTVRRALEGCRVGGLAGVAVPRLGCGIGGLGWGEVRPLLEQAAGEFPDVTLEFWSPY